MRRKYSIHKKGKQPVGYLYYEEESRKYSMDILVKDTTVEMPAILYCCVKRKIFHLDDDLARLYVKEHVIPADRAGINDILKMLGFPYYDEIFFLDKFKGKSVMDDFLTERIE